MMQKGTIIENFLYLCSEREKPCTQRTHTSTLHVRSLSKGMKKTVKPVLMSKEEFFTKVVKTTDNNGNV